MHGHNKNSGDRVPDHTSMHYIPDVVSHSVYKNTVRFTGNAMQRQNDVLCEDIWRAALEHQHKIMPHISALVS